MSSLKQLNERMEEIKERRVSHPGPGGGGARGRTPRPPPPPAAVGDRWVDADDSYADSLCGYEAEAVAAAGPSNRSLSNSTWVELCVKRNLWKVSWQPGGRGRGELNSVSA
jgi:hypothetical protein